MPARGALRHPDFRHSLWNRLVLATIALTVGLTSSALAETISIPLELSADQIRLETTADGTRVSVDGARVLRDFGRPQLPTVQMEVLIPRDMSVASVRVEGGKVYELEVPGTLLLDKGQPVEGGPRLEEVQFDKASGVYPPVAARLTSDQFEHGYHVVGITAYPVRQLQDGQLEARVGGQVILELEHRPSMQTIAHREREMPGWRQKVQSRLARRLANPEALFGYVLPPSFDVSGQKLEPAGKTPSLSTSPVEMLILTNDALAAEFQRLADHRTATGLPALVVTIEDILGSYRQGVDLPETIRLYLADAYSKWGVDYLLLGGDTDIIPARYAHSTFYPPGSTTDIPADLYYGALDGNWNADGDALFGEPFINGIDAGDFVDFTPEMAVGRAPVSTVSAAMTFIDKVLAYEIPVNTDYQTRFLAASEVLFPSIWTEGEIIQLDGAIFSEDINASILAADTDGVWDIDRLYENETAYPDTTYPGAPGMTPAATDETRSGVLAAMDTGNYGMCNQIGHGFYFNMSVGDDNILVSDADVLTNGPNYFVLYALNCSSGAFDFNCLMERFLNNPNGGSVASLGSSRAAFPNTANDYQQAFFSALYTQGNMLRLGDALGASRIPFTPDTFYNTSDRWTHFVYNLLGDPSMPVWSDVPQAIDIAAPASLPLGPSNVTVTVTESGTANPVEGATVALSTGADYAVGTTDASGQVTLAFDVELPGNVAVWASGTNVIPSSVTVPVTAGGSAFLAVDSFSLSDDTGGGSLGNGNGRFEGGETIELRPLVRNSGGGASVAGTLTLTSGDPFITILDGTAAIGAIGAGGTLSAGDVFLVQVDAALPDAHEVSLDIALNAGSTFNDTEVIVAGAPEIEVLFIEFDDTTFGNGNGTIDPTEEVELIVTLKNYGSGATLAVVGSLATSDPDVTILDGSGTWGALSDPLATDSNDANRFRVSESTVGASNELQLTLTDDAGRMMVHVFDLQVPGQVQDVELGVAGPGEIKLLWTANTDPDIAGYMIYRKGDNDVDFILASPDLVAGSSLYGDFGLGSLESFDYFVRALDTGRMLGPASTTIQASTAPPEVSCFPLPIGLETSSDLAIGHLDTDGTLDLVIGSDWLYVIDGDCLEKKDGDLDPQTFGPVSSIAGKYEPASIALGELDGDGGLEIVASNWVSSELYVFDEQGNVLPGWPVQLATKNWSTPAIGDLDNDGDREIVVNDTAGWTYAFHHDGTEVADGDNNPATLGRIAPQRVGESFGRTSPALYDVDGDNIKEILFGTKFQNDLLNEFFYALKIDGSGGNAAGWPKQFAPRAAFLASPSIGDLNNDGTDEIVVIGEGDQLYVWEPDGSNFGVFPQPYTSQSMQASSLAPSVALGDFTEDGNLEMVVVETVLAGQSRIRILDHTNTTLPGWPVTTESLSESSPVVGDINGDGDLDVVFGSGGGADNLPNFLYAWNLDGSLVTGFPITLSGFPRATPTLTDFNGDGNVNIVMASWDKLIHVWDLQKPYDPNLMPWPTFRGNVNRNGVYEHTVVTSAPEEVVPRIVQPLLAQNHPNPFNPATTISWKVPGSVGHEVNLAIFDAAGRHVVTLEDGFLAPGSYSRRWDGRSATGGAVSSGTYFVRLRVEGHDAVTRKMTLLK